MRVLHLFSNWRWTGPAEPAVNLCAALRGRGVEVQFACGQEPSSRDNAVRRRATELGLTVLQGYLLHKHFAPLASRRDAREIAAALAAPPDIIHSHLIGDHGVALRIARRLSPRPRVVRSFYVADTVEAPIRTRRALAGGTDAAIAPCRIGAELIGKRLGFSPERIALIEVGIDTERFNPERPLPDARAELGLVAGEPVLGIIARIQGHRRYPAFIEAVAVAAKSVPNLKVLVLGRGPQKERLALAPARRLGVADRFVFSDYRWGDDFVAAVACFDACVFLVPGTDGTCRAIREAMAMGKPVIASRRGIVPELIEDGRTGLIVDGSVESLSRAIISLLSDPARRRTIGEAARAEALRRFPLVLQAERVCALYEALLAGRAPAEAAR